MFYWIRNFFVKAISVFLHNINNPPFRQIADIRRRSSAFNAWKLIQRKIGKDDLPRGIFTNPVKQLFRRMDKLKHAAADTGIRLQIWKVSLVEITQNGFFCATDVINRIIFYIGV